MQIITNSDHIYNKSVDTINITKYIAVRTSGYMQMPFMAKLFSIYFPKTVLIYSIREKLTQRYSLWEHFGKKKGSINDSFKENLDIFNEDKFQRNIWSLVNYRNQSIVREQLVYEILRYGFDKDSQWISRVNHICPYLNVLFWWKLTEIWNHEYIFGKFKIVQSEWVYEDTLRAAVYLHCIAKIEDSTSQRQFDECAQWSYNNMNMILSNESVNRLGRSFGKSHGYTYEPIDMMLFDQLTEFVEICDKRLFEFIHDEKYQSLTIGTDWKYQRWVDKRESMRKALFV